MALCLVAEGDECGGEGFIDNDDIGIAAKNRRVESGSLELGGRYADGPFGVSS